MINYGLQSGSRDKCRKISEINCSCATVIAELLTFTLILNTDFTVCINTKLL